MKVKRIGTHDLPVPSAAEPGSAGIDLRACLPATAAVNGQVYLNTGQRLTIPCGFAFGFETHQMGFVCSRSGLAAKHGVFVVNSPGVLDQTYRGEVMVILSNLGTEPFAISHGDRIAQLLVRFNYPVPALIEVDELDQTERGDGGLGSTGVK